MQLLCRFQELDTPRGEEENSESVAAAAAEEAAVAVVAAEATAGRNASASQIQGVLRGREGRQARRCSILGILSIYGNN